MKYCGPTEIPTTNNEPIPCDRFYSTDCVIYTPDSIALGIIGDTDTTNVFRTIINNLESNNFRLYTLENNIGGLTHSSLFGLDTDDHTQYLNETRADTWLASKTLEGTGLTAIDEGNGVGWRLKGTPTANVGNIGFHAIDMGEYYTSSTTEGALATHSFIGNGDSNTIRGDSYGAFTLGGGANLIEGYSPGAGALGNFNTINQGYTAIALGTYNTINTSFLGGGVIAVGHGNSATGEFPLGALGLALDVRTRNHLAVGVANVIYTGSTAAADRPIFTVGIGTHSTPTGQWTAIDRKDGLNVLANGTVLADSLTPDIIDAEATGKVLTTREWTMAALATGAKLVNVTYESLTTLISESELVKGQLYLLTDYMTTYTQPVTGATKSSGITEPLYLIATDVDKLSNIAYSQLYPQDIVYYEVTGNIDDGKGDEGFTKGKIYRRIDTQRNNDIGTDWRHVKYDRDGVDKLLFEDYTGCRHNVIKTYYLFDNVVGSEFRWNIIGDYFYSNTIGDSCYSNTIRYTFQSNTITNFFADNTINSNFTGNTIDFYFNNNVVGYSFYNNTISSYFHNNTIGNEFSDNTIGSNFKNNQFTVATLPTGVSAGQEFIVTDALNPTYLGTLAGGGTTICPVFYNGTSWVFR